MHHAFHILIHYTTLHQLIIYLFLVVVEYLRLTRKLSVKYCMCYDVMNDISVFNYCFES
jgi:hypothetical protein